MPRSVAGENVGVLLRGVKREFVDRGMFLGAPGHLKQSDHFAGRFYMLTAAEGGRTRPITTGFASVAYVSTWTIPARLELGDRPMVMPGELIDHAEFILQKPMVLCEGLRFFIRERGHTIISGVITEVLPESGREILGFNRVVPKRMVVESNASVIRRKRSVRSSKPPST